MLKRIIIKLSKDKERILKATRKKQLITTHHLKELEREEQTKPKVSRGKEIIKIREEINKIEIKTTIEKIDKTKSWFSERINEIDKPLARLPKRKERRPK